ncbi:MAG: folate family ECF transporter S component [Clostridiales bacterium]|jgi:ECF transporter S component (folate family)|nr:folate family ECF transporter S component [Clostridiales bacterium]
MKDTGNRFQASARMLRNTHALTAIAMLGALSIILGYFSFQIGNVLKISFAFLPQEAAAFLFGPVATPIMGAVMDIINYLIKPTGPFFPGFTISAALTGLIAGLGLFRRPLSVKRTAVTLFINMVLVNVVLNTLWLSILYGQAYKVILPMRIVKELIMWPIQTALLFAMLKAVDRIGILGRLESRFAGR